MGAGLIVLGAAVVSALVVVAGWVRGRHLPPDRGFVSNQWVAEHRMSQTQDLRR